MMEQKIQHPWYRQFWPWFLIALPASALIASSITCVIALRHADEVVPEYAAQRSP
ncbi:MAG TPA: FixH family protein [Gammaproteobacteria bacterium]